VSFQAGEDAMVDGGVFVVCVFFARKYTFLAQIELFKTY